MTTSFNGAAPARARNGRHGNQRDHHVHASTGPRPRGRGMCCQFGGALLVWRSFNGAAPARARNDNHH